MTLAASAHHRARKLQGFDHTLRLMAPQFVKPYVKANKNARTVWSLLAHDREFRFDYAGA
jgi:transposase